MELKKENLSDYEEEGVPDGAAFSIAIVVSEWNRQVTEAMYEGAYKALISHGVSKGSVQRYEVPGTFELPSVAAALAKRKSYDAIICIGCVIQGETRHFDFISQATAQGIMNVSTKYRMPVIFGVLTTDTMSQAIERAGGNKGNKGIEAAITALKMADLFKKGF